MIYTQTAFFFPREGREEQGGGAGREGERISSRLHAQQSLMWGLP